ncbi:MAG: hypothetical protein ABH865_07195 [Candidatus Omnitrophota bacterium]|nr:nucleotidyltransferase family protein [Candidatus Omnitrophota bacterium]
MDFEKVLPLIIKDFEEARVQYAVIGGFALGALGIMRSTMDLDFLINADDVGKVAKVMKRYDYTCVHKTENVSQYLAGSKLFGEIDFIHAFRAISLSMLARARQVSFFSGALSLAVVCPEDIIGLKVQALANDEGRIVHEYADIEEIAAHCRGNLDWKLIKEYFYLFKKEKEFKRLQKKYGKTH